MYQILGWLPRPQNKVAVASVLEELSFIRERNMQLRNMVQCDKTLSAEYFRTQDKAFKSAWGEEMQLK